MMWLWAVAAIAAFYAPVVVLYVVVRAVQG